MFASTTEGARDDMSEVPRITDDMIEKARADIGRERRARAHFTEITADIVRIYALGIGDDNPLWVNEKYAAESVGGVVAPPSFLWTSFMTPLFFPSDSKVRSTGAGMPGIQALFAGAQLRFDRPIRPGDRLRSVSTRVGMVDPEARVEGDLIDDRVRIDKAIAAMSSYNPKPGGRAVYQVERHTAFNLDSGEQIGSLIEFPARIEPWAIDPADGKYGSWTPRAYSPEEMGIIGDHYAQEHTHRRGAEPRYWEDVNVGDELPRLVKGPLTLLSLCAFFGGFQPAFNLTDRVLYSFASRFPESIKFDPGSGIWLLPEDMHWQPEMYRILGMPGGMDIGSQRIAWMTHLITDWMGDAAWLDSFDVWFVRPMFLSETAWISGRVVSKSPGAQSGQIVIEVGAETFDGEPISTAEGTVTLPMRGNRTPVWNL
jgi:acyl dehydratase